MKWHVAFEHQNNTDYFLSGKAQEDKIIASMITFNAIEKLIS